jgi:hypothetical protein
VFSGVTFVSISTFTSIDKQQPTSAVYIYSTNAFSRLLQFTWCLTFFLCCYVCMHLVPHLPSIFILLNCFKLFSAHYIILQCLTFYALLFSVVYVHTLVPHLSSILSSILYFISQCFYVHAFCVSFIVLLSIHYYYIY